MSRMDGAAGPSQFSACPCFALRRTWTLHNEENWNRTHRLAGGVWILAGVFFLLDALFDFRRMWLILILMVLVPAAYSLYIYFNEHRQGS